MPFGKPFDDYYKEILVPAIKDAGLKAIRADEVYGVRPIIDDIANSIITAEVIIADVTGKNPNVNYELGMAHALAKQVIIISQDSNDIPFDYRHVRAVVYETADVQWADKLKTKITKTVKQIRSDKNSHYIIKPILEIQVNSLSQGAWGLDSIYESRQEMNVRSTKLFTDMKRQLDLCAFGLKSFRDSRTRLIREKVKSGLQMRILAPFPESPFVKQRELDEHVVNGDIKKSIYDLTKWVKRIEKVSSDPDRIGIKYYQSLPLDYYCHQDETIFVGPYMFGKGSQQTITYEFRKGGIGYDYFEDYFEELWADDDFCTPDINALC